LSKTLLLTGGAGFIGSHTVEHFLKNTDWNIIVIDRLTYAGSLNKLTNMDCWEKEKRRVKFVYHDFRASIEGEIYNILTNPKPDYIIHMGAESHVDNSIENPMLFAKSNVIGTVNMLEFQRRVNAEKLIYVSTDEVYGSVTKGYLHQESNLHKPSNPYSASKAGAEDFCYAYHNTYGLPVIVTNTMNNIGQRQSPEKFVPKTIISILENKPVILHCKKENGTIVDVSSRCWLHARNHADALLFLLDKGVPGEKYNVSGELKTVEEVADLIGNFIGMDIDKRFEDFHSFRRGHDMHYGLDGSKLNNMGWNPPTTFIDSLKETVKWSLNHKEWLGLE